MSTDTSFPTYGESQNMHVILQKIHDNIWPDSTEDDSATTEYYVNHVTKSRDNHVTIM